MNGEVLSLVLIAAVIFAVMMGVRSYARSQARSARALGLPPALPLRPTLPQLDPSLGPVAVGPPAGFVPPTPPTAIHSGVLRASREQAVLLRRHFPPRAGSLSHWGGVPVVPRGFTWPFVVLPDGADRALTFVLQVDCAAIPAEGRLGLMPDRGQLYVFLDLDWATHWVWSVRYEDGDADGFVPGRLPAGLPRAYPQRAIWGWPQRDEDWPSLLPTWSVEPVLVIGDVTPPPVEAESDERDFWPGTLDIGRALDGIDGAVVPMHSYENTYDDGVLVRPYATYPHDWHAVRILTGLVQSRLQDRFHSRGELSDEDVASLRGAVRSWADRAAEQEQWSPVSQEDSDAVWQLVLDFQSVTLFSLSDAVNESLDATLAGNPDATTLLPDEALDLARIRHSLASTGEQGRHTTTAERMLCPPSYVQGDAAERIGEWLLLLELSSDPQIGHHFGEGVLQFWIRPDDLAARRFDRVELTASAY